MRSSRVNIRDLLAAGALFGIATAYGLGSLGYSLGSANAMGPGYFPLIVSAALATLAAIMFATALVERRPANDGERLVYRPFLGVILSLAGFAVGMHWLGLIPAILLTVGILATFQRAPSLPAAATLAVGMSIFSWLVFNIALGLPMPAFREVF